MDLSRELGQTIEDYEVTRLLGKGGFAQVYHAICKKTGVEVAIKMIDKEKMRRAGLTSRVQQEVSIHCRLRHPSILELLTFFEDDGFVYLIVEFCQGGEVQKYLEQRGTFDESEARHFLIQVVHGMQYLQSHRILHRDLSLSNLLLTSEKQVKIADFGLATQLRFADEKHTTMCGTPNYIPPEIATRTEHGLEVDLWSLGCMLYTFLTGAPPFHDTKIRSTLTKVVMSSVHLPVHLSTEARDLIERLLQKNPRQRLPLSEVLSHPFVYRSSSLLKRKPFREARGTDQSKDLSRPCTPLSTTRLKPTRIKSGKLMLSILDSGEVCVEFLKGDNVSNVVRVSADGRWVIAYRSGLAWHPTQPAPLPVDGTNDRHCVDRLPQSLWKKYAIAARFVHLVRQKTVKIVLYQNDISCFLMENGDVELKTSTGKKVSQISDGSVKLNGRVVSLMSLDIQDRELLRSLSLKLKSLEEVISTVDSSPNMYPAIFGRRISADVPSRSNFTLGTNFTSLVDRSPESLTAGHGSDTRGVREVHVDGVGVGKQLEGGGVCVQFYDKTQLSVPTGQKRVAFTDRHGVRTEYPSGSQIPAHVQQRLGYLPKVIQMLK
ncbi:serine/threonine-protein kinase PLK4-like [Tropilaelaps mercedesae]|uniref:Serine/threonine-protein kinase PLK4 n=1 Tax=Tropilaelaps mercedesae TaxID=418985 RepID=A0A1V9XB14_9ACAR|nr:serine/threonine-protein kinase PLK4-like [Tropilaelaps mercedesae]